jgi:hypothetical protein
MPPRKFSFLPDTLLEDANCVADHWEEHGFAVKQDKTLMAAPSVPTLHAKRHKTELIGLVSIDVEKDRLKDWCAYAKSTGRDFRVVAICPRKTKINARDLDFMRHEGIGLLRNNHGIIIEEIAPRDLGLVVGLPSLRSLPPTARKHLGSAYEQFERSHWREGFEDACQSLENLSRDYLLEEIAKGRVTQFITKKSTTKASVAKVKKMTLGQLAHAFTQIPNQNRTDAQLAQILPKINKDRIGVVHHKHKAKTEARLRKNVGMHMWSIIGGIKLFA